MVNQILALFSCDHLLSIVVYSKIDIAANIIASMTHLILAMMFDL